MLKGLAPLGVPKKLINTTFTFIYGDFKALTKLVKLKKIGIIKMEVCRSTKPNISFLKKVRKLCTKKNIILIFDECTTGFRECLGGIHKKIKISKFIYKLFNSIISLKNKSNLSFKRFCFTTSQL